MTDRCGRCSATSPTAGMLPISTTTIGGLMITCPACTRCCAREQSGPTLCAGLCTPAHGNRSAATNGSRSAPIRDISASGAGAAGSTRTASRSTRSPARLCCAGGPSRCLTVAATGSQRVPRSQDRIPRRADGPVQRLLRAQRNGLDASLSPECDRRATVPVVRLGSPLIGLGHSHVGAESCTQRVDYLLSATAMAHCP